MGRSGTVTGIVTVIFMMLGLSQDAAWAWIPASPIQQLFQKSQNPTLRNGYAAGSPTQVRQGYFPVKGNQVPSYNPTFSGTPVYYPQSLQYQGYSVAPSPQPTAQVPAPVVAAPLSLACPTCPSPVPGPTCPAPVPAPPCPAPVRAPTCPAPVPTPICPAPVPAPTCPAPVPAPTCPAPVVCPAPVAAPSCPEPVPAPVCPAPEPVPTCPEPAPPCPAPEPAPVCPAPEVAPPCPVPEPAPTCPAPAPPCPDPVVPPPSPAAPSPVTDPASPAPVAAPTCAEDPFVAETKKRILDVDNWMCATKTDAAGVQHGCVVTGTSTSSSAPAPGTHCDWIMPQFCDPTVNEIAATMAVTPPTPPPAPSDYVFVENQGYFKLHTETKIWDEAKAICEAEGTSLAIPLTPEDYSPLSNMYLTGMKSASQGFFVGFTNRLTHDSFDFLIDTNGQPACTTGSISFQPIYHGMANENCTGLNYARNPLMQDLDCKWKIPFMCQQRLPSRYKLYPCT